MNEKQIEKLKLENEKLKARVTELETLAEELRKGRDLLFNRVGVLCRERRK